MVERGRNVQLMVFLSSSAAYSIHLTNIPISGWNAEDAFLSAIPNFIHAVDVDASEALTNNDDNYVDSLY